MQHSVHKALLVADALGAVSLLLHFAAPASGGASTSEPPAN